MSALIRASRKRPTVLDERPKLFEISSELWSAYLALRGGRTAVFDILPLCTSDILAYLDCLGFNSDEKIEGLRVLRRLDNIELAYWRDMKAEKNEITEDSATDNRR